MSQLLIEFFLKSVTVHFISLVFNTFTWCAIENFEDVIFNSLIIIFFHLIIHLCIIIIKIKYHEF